MGGITSYLFPSWLNWFQGYWITISLGVIMFGMGVTLSFEDFKNAFIFPKWIIIGMCLQYFIMPIGAYLISYSLNLSNPIAVGLILVGCCPGGTASNVVTYLAKGNVPLSVTMTAISTILAIVLTPVLCSLLIGSRVEVNGWGLLESTVQVVLFPVILGIAVNQFLGRFSKYIIHISPFLAIIGIILIVSSVLGNGRDKLMHSGWEVIASVALLHFFGFIISYLITSLFSKDKIISRTISIEVGMQNSGLGVVLAQQNFTNPLIAIPSAISSITHCLIGSLLAASWRKENHVSK